ncbi:MAG: pyridoxamine 5'-phosphate oxidase family protein [Candidatus Pacearchaeota archaeon]|nr:MAG: pyridoxamine 5'-phosphate oxidase family protein [Candidatus Pacearchaeota archaeon]
MVRIDKKLKNLIQKNILAFATSYSKKPNVVAIACVKVTGPDTLVITDNYMNKTKKNLLKNKNVAIVVWNKKGTIGYQLKGKANYITKGKWLKFVKNMKENKEMPAKAAIIVKVKEVYKLA